VEETFGSSWLIALNVEDAAGVATPNNGAESIGPDAGVDTTGMVVGA